jgi:transposase
LLLPHLADVEVETVSLAAGPVRIMARTKAAQAGCPECGTVSRRVHSRYERRLLDTAITGREVVICLEVRYSTPCGMSTQASSLVRGSSTWLLAGYRLDAANDVSVRPRSITSIHWSSRVSNR